MYVNEFKSHFKSHFSPCMNNLHIEMSYIHQMPMTNQNTFPQIWIIHAKLFFDGVCFWLEKDLATSDLFEFTICNSYLYHNRISSRFFFLSFLLSIPIFVCTLCPPFSFLLLLLVYPPKHVFFPPLETKEIQTSTKSVAKQFMGFWKCG